MWKYQMCWWLDKQQELTLQSFFHFTVIYFVYKHIGKIITFLEDFLNGEYTAE